MAADVNLTGVNTPVPFQAGIKGIVESWKISEPSIKFPLISKIRCQTFRGRTPGLLTSIGKAFLEALIYIGPTKFVANIGVNSRCNKVYQK